MEKKVWNKPEVNKLQLTQTQTDEECTCGASHGMFISAIVLVNGMKMVVKRQKNILEMINVMKFIGMNQRIQNVVVEQEFLKIIMIFSNSR